MCTPSKTAERTIPKVEVRPKIDRAAVGAPQNAASERDDIAVREQNGLGVREWDDIVARERGDLDSRERGDRAHEHHAAVSAFASSSRAAEY